MAKKSVEYQLPKTAETYLTHLGIPLLQQSIAEPDKHWKFFMNDTFLGKAAKTTAIAKQSPHKFLDAHPFTVFTSEDKNPPSYVYKTYFDNFDTGIGLAYKSNGHELDRLEEILSEDCKSALQIQGGGHPAIDLSKPRGRNYTIVLRQDQEALLVLFNDKKALKVANDFQTEYQGWKERKINMLKKRMF